MNEPKVLDMSFLTFVYPFSFDPDSFEVLVSAVNGAKAGTEDSAPPFWDPDKFPHNELLPHIAGYLSNEEGKKPTARLWKISHTALESPKFIGAKAQWRFAYGRKDQDAPQDQAGEKREIPFSFSNIQLFLFRAGVGMLSIQIKLQSDSLVSWQDFLHYFRFFGRRNSHVAARLSTGKDTYKDFFPPFAAGGNPREDGIGDIGEIVEALLGTADTTVWWRDAFIHNQMLPYSAIFVDGHPKELDYHLCYKLRNIFHSGQGRHPAPSDLVSDHKSLLEYSERQWFLFAQDGGHFLACDPPDTVFFRETLPDHIRDQYFHLFAIALHQRFALMDMSHEVAEHWWSDDDDKRMEAFDRIRDRFLSFSARGFFAQVMQREHHHRNYRIWQETFEVQRIFDEVREEVAEMFGWLQMKRTAKIEKAAQEQAELLRKETKEAARREREAKEEAARIEKEANERASHVERRLNFIGLLLAAGIGIPSLISGFFGINIMGLTEDHGLSLAAALLWFFGSLIISLFFALVIFRMLNRRAETKMSNKATGGREKQH